MLQEVGVRWSEGKEATTLLAPGEKAPDFELESTAGRKVRIGLITPLWSVLLIFFRNGCEACRLLVPHLGSFQRNYGDADIEILGVSQDGKLRTADFLEATKWRGRVLLDHPALEASRAYGIETLPSGVLIGTDMRIRAVADATDLESFERLAEAVASEVGWNYKPVLPPELRAATVPRCMSKSLVQDRTTGAA